MVSTEQWAPARDGHRHDGAARHARGRGPARRHPRRWPVAAALPRRPRAHRGVPDPAAVGAGRLVGAPPRPQHGGLRRLRRARAAAPLGDPCGVARAGGARLGARRAHRPPHHRREQRRAGLAQPCRAGAPPPRRRSRHRAASPWRGHDGAIDPPPRRPGPLHRGLPPAHRPPHRERHRGDRAVRRPRAWDPDRRDRRASAAPGRAARRGRTARAPLRGPRLQGAGRDGRPDLRDHRRVADVEGIAVRRLLPVAGGHPALPRQGVAPPRHRPGGDRRGRGARGGEPREGGRDDARVRERHRAGSLRRRGRAAPPPAPAPRRTAPHRPTHRPLTERYRPGRSGRTRCSGKADDRRALQAHAPPQPTRSRRRRPSTPSPPCRACRCGHSRPPQQVTGQSYVAEHVATASRGRSITG